MHPGGPGRELLGRPPDRPTQRRPYGWQMNAPAGSAANAGGPPDNPNGAVRHVHLQDGEEPTCFGAAPWNRNREARGQPRQGQGAPQPSQAAGPANTTAPSGRDLPVLVPRSEADVTSVERPGGNPGEERARLPERPPEPPSVRREPTIARVGAVVRNAMPKPSRAPDGSLTRAMNLEVSHPKTLSQISGVST